MLAVACSTSGDDVSPRLRRNPRVWMLPDTVLDTPTGHQRLTIVPLPILTEPQLELRRCLLTRIRTDHRNIVRGMRQPIDDDLEDKYKPTASDIIEFVFHQRDTDHM